ncbi:hypothetical protein PtA15_2A219 [Puccinia triticina]|uniref:Uncharacterized protein n=1 Tax=Puccinia triticina TaxID=208348 RepID=A0ABY7C9P7_9BASI|nr:uncharacterized protein PtA15_2A219 [Puccinia triticina]WAQ81906.1 hypothetical protein PtA15_2A219 [Puccinia triticina]
MIVTPVILVWTASGRQAAVQQVALRGQEKARVVRLPPSGHPHGPSPLLLCNGTTSSTIRSLTANVRETFGFLPTTPGIGRARATLARPHSGQQPSPSLSIHQAFDFEHPSAAGLRGSTLDPFSDLSALAAMDKMGQEEEQHNKGREDIGSLPSNNKNEHVGRKSSTNLRRARSTAAYLIASSRFGRSSICDSFIKDEEVEFPTVLGRSAATLAQRILHNSTTRCRARAARLHIIM